MAPLLFDLLQSPPQKETGPNAQYLEAACSEGAGSAIHDVIIESAYLWLEDVNTIQFNAAPLEGAGEVAQAGGGIALLAQGLLRRKKGAHVRLARLVHPLFHVEGRSRTAACPRVCPKLTW